MSKTLLIMYDLDTKAFVGASLGGKILSGVASVSLSKAGLSVRDDKGQDLLSPATSKSTASAQAPTSSPPSDSAPTPDFSKAQADIAAAFGFKDDSTVE